MFGAKWRRCLKCNIQFESVWVGNRLCDSCGEKNKRASNDFEHYNPYLKSQPYLTFTLLK